MLGALAIRSQRPFAAAATVGRAMRFSQRRLYTSKGGQVLEATEANFEKDVLESPVPTVVDFYADWCGPCKMLGPIIEKAVKKDGRVNLAKVNVDENLTLASDYKITSLPTVVGFRNGEPVAAFVGMRPPAAVEEFIQSIATDTEK
ncbi:hypothetical protein IW136_000572 [Coemansia sp. RSA 678]|nr:hypothetical protein IW136_000572 [Coemansia sp. RSA 678]